VQGLKHYFATLAYDAINVPDYLLPHGESTGSSNHDRDSQATCVALSPEKKECG